MVSARTVRFRATLAVARRDPRNKAWHDLWAEIAAQYRRGELSDAEYDRMLSEMP